MSSSPRVCFYDVAPEGRWPLLVRLAQAAWQKRLRFLILCRDRDEARAVDELLWTFEEQAFLPHELVEGAHPEDPEARIVITTAEHDPIGATILFQLTPASEAFARRFETVIDLVDHRDPERLAASRQRFRAWRDAGSSPDYRPG